jgi:High potential iron-sulfur protein
MSPDRCASRRVTPGSQVCPPGSAHRRCGRAPQSACNTAPASSCRVRSPSLLRCANPLGWNFRNDGPAQALARHGTLDIMEPQMRGRTAMPTSGSSRRVFFIKTIGAVAAATCGRVGAAKAQDYKPQEQKKLTQAAARYQDHPKENQSCGNCPYFSLPNGCVVVEGEISAFGWCPMYTTFVPLDRGGHA